MEEGECEKFSIRFSEQVECGHRSLWVNEDTRFDENGIVHYSRVVATEFDDEVREEKYVVHVNDDGADNGITCLESKFLD